MGNSSESRGVRGSSGFLLTAPVRPGSRAHANPHISPRPFRGGPHSRDSRARGDAGTGALGLLGVASSSVRILVCNAKCYLGRCAGTSGGARFTCQLVWFAPSSAAHPVFSAALGVARRGLSPGLQHPLGSKPFVFEPALGDATFPWFLPVVGTCSIDSPRGEQSAALDEQRGKPRRDVAGSRRTGRRQLVERYERCERRESGVRVTESVALGVNDLCMEPRLRKCRVTEEGALQYMGMWRYSVPACVRYQWYQRHSAYYTQRDDYGAAHCIFLFQQHANQPSLGSTDIPHVAAFLAHVSPVPVPFLDLDCFATSVSAPGLTPWLVTSRSADAPLAELILVVLAPRQILTRPRARIRAIDR